MSVKDRVLSEFMAREMIVDYVLGNLDAGESTAFDRTIGENSHLRDEIRRLEGALGYCKKLAALPVVEEPLEGLARSSLSRARDWGLEVWSNPKARMVTAVAAVCFFGVGVYRALPPQVKERLVPSQITLFEVKRNIEPPTPTIADLQGDSPQVAQQPAQDIAAPVAAQQGTSPSPQTSPPVVTVAPVSPQTQPQTAMPADEMAAAGPPGKFKGFVYRAFTFTSRIETVSPQIRDKILSLGGAKAGEVDLGWRKRGGRYFHFTLPQSRYEDLIAAIQAYGPVRIQKDPHPRIMPEGQIRFILWLEDRGQGDFTPDETKSEPQPAPE